MKLNILRVFSFVALIGILPSLALLQSCGEDNGPDTDDGYNREALLQVYSNWLQTEYSLLENELTDFQTEIEAFKTQADDNTLLKLQEAFKTSYIQWQRLDFLPIESAMDAYLVESANTYPTKAELIETNIADENTNLEPINQLAAQGFPGLEYLLFTKEIEYLSDAKTIAYIDLLSQRLIDKVKSTTDGWQAQENDFIKNSGSDGGSSISTLFNALVKNFEQRTRDAKIGVPAGVRTDNIIQPEQCEALYAGYSLELLNANISALKDFFNGTADEGFDNYLDYLKSEKDGQPLSAAINAQFDAITVSIEAIDWPLSESIKTDKLPAINAFNEMQKMVVLLKVDMAPELGILINYADNDGDS